MTPPGGPPLLVARLYTADGRWRRHAAERKGALHCPNGHRLAFPVGAREGVVVCTRGTRKCGAPGCGGAAYFLAATRRNLVWWELFADELERVDREHLWLPEVAALIGLAPRMVSA